MAQFSPWFAAAYPALNAYLASGGTVADLIPIRRARRAEHRERGPQPRFNDEEGVLEAYMGQGVKLEPKAQA